MLEDACDEIERTIQNLLRVSSQLRMISKIVKRLPAFAKPISAGGRSDKVMRTTRI
jgi:hypothetical protein